MDIDKYLEEHCIGYKKTVDGKHATGRFHGCSNMFMEGLMGATGLVFFKSSAHHRGSSKRLKTTIPTARTLKFSHSNSVVPIPYTGHLFEIMSFEVWKCGFTSPELSSDYTTDEDALNHSLAEKGTKRRKRKHSKVFAKCNATVMIRVLKFYEPPVFSPDSKPSKKEQDHAKAAHLKNIQTNDDQPYTIVCYCRFPLSMSHPTHNPSDQPMTKNRLDPRIANKIKQVALEGIYDVKSVRKLMRDFVYSTLFASVDKQELPQLNNTRYFPHDNTIQNHIMNAVGPKKGIVGYQHPSKLPQENTEAIVQEVVNSPEDMQMLDGCSGVGLVALHLGAGYHSPERWPRYKVLCEQALTAAVEILKNKGTAGEAVTLAVQILENSELTNAGFGSNLTESGDVECDASVMDTSHRNSKAGEVTFGSVSCVGRIKNPVEAAYMMSLQQAKKSKLLLGRILPCSMSGTGAEKWAKAHHVDMCEADDLASESAYKTWMKYQRRIAEHILHKRSRDTNSSSEEEEERETAYKQQRLDTVGAVALDFYGSVASAASSGGLLMKLPGRVGQAATFGCGCWAQMGKKDEPTVAVASSGCGEQLVYTTIAKKCAENLRHCDEPYQAVQDTLLKDFLGSSFLSPEANRQAGLLTLHLSKDGEQISTEVVWGHTTSSMLIGHMSTRDTKPEILVSRLPDGAVSGKSVSVSGTWIKVSSESTTDANGGAKDFEIIPPDDVTSGQLDGNDDTASIKMDKCLSIMWMSETLGGLSMDECGVNLSNEFNRKVDVEFEKLISNRWSARVEKNPRLFNGLKFRIHSVTTYKEGPKKLIFNLGLTCYRDYMETNWAKEADSLKEKGRQSVTKCEQDFFSDPLGVAGVVVTSDEKVILQRRNHWVAEGAGELDVPGGHPEPKEVQPDVTLSTDVSVMNARDVTEEVFLSQLKEVRDEVNVPLKFLEQPKLIGIVMNELSAGRPVAYYVIRCSLSSNQIEELYKKGGAESDESTQCLFLSVKEVIYLERDNSDLWNQFCPNGKAAITLFSVLHQREQGQRPFQIT